MCLSPECSCDGGKNPCGRRIVNGITTCRFCSNLDGSPECKCWTPVADVPDEVWERSGLKLKRQKAN